MTMLALIYFLSVIGIVLIGLAVIVRKSNASQRFFAVVCMALAFWLVCQYFVDNSLHNNKLWMQVSFLAYELAAPAFLAFIYAYPSNRIIPRRWWWGLSLPLLIFGPFTFSNLLINDASATSGAVIFDPGPLYLPQTLFVLGYFIAAFWVLIKRYKGLTYQQMNQVRILILAFFVPLVVNLMGGLIFTDSVIFQYLRPVSFLGMAILIMYTMVYHKLFDLKLVVARSLGYVISIGLIVIVFAFSSATMTQKILGYQTESGASIAINAVMLILAIIAYPYVKSFFDKVTNQLFYRDSYDPQVFLDELNKTLVGNIEIGILLRHTAGVIERNLKTECHIYVSGSQDNAPRIMGSTRMEIDQEDLEFIFSEISTVPDKTVVEDDLQDEYKNLKNALDKNNIAVISSLVTSYASSREATAYLILSPKKSGNSYSKQDIRLINIITDELLIAIQNALRFEEIQSFNITLQNRINDATAKLKRSNEKLKEMDETKDEFISMASHQLRTPLTSVKGYLSMVLDGDAGKITENQQQLLNQAYVSSQRMVYLIADLLNVSRLKTGKFVINAAPTDLAEMVDGEVNQLKEVAKSRKLTITFNKPKNVPELYIDETKTRQVIMNFIDNAIYYSPNGGKIKVELKADRSCVYFMVKDNGMGVPKREQAHLFTKFYRAKNAQKARPDGTGLGLFMAKKVINDQGGAILFESEEGKGSTFGFKFDIPKDKK